MLFRIPMILALGSLMSLTACQVRGLPSHGGGKRFFREQEVLSRASQASLDGINWSALNGKKVSVLIFAIGDEGGGAQSGGGLSLGGMMGGGGGMSKGPASMAGSGSVGMEGMEHTPFAVANARDIEYLRGSVMSRVFEAGGIVVDSANGGSRTADVVVLAHVFGLDRWTEREYMVFRTEHIDARVALSVWEVQKSGGARSLNREPNRWSQADFYYIEEYLFGFTRDQDGMIVDPRSDPAFQRS